MTINRRRFIGTTSAVAAGASIVSKTGVSSPIAQDPYEPADKGRVAKLFNKGEQHILPAWAFQASKGSPLGIVPHTLRPVLHETWANLSGGASHQPKVAPYASLGDQEPIGKVMHGIAVEWNGNLIGGNLNYNAETKTWSPAASAWEAMRERVRPETTDEYGIKDLGNWGKFGVGPESPEPADAKDCLVRCYKIEMFEILKRVAPNFPPALFYSYQGTVPGPLFRSSLFCPSLRFRSNWPSVCSRHWATSRYAFLQSEFC